MTFENITYKIGVGSRHPQATFGLLAGQVAESAVLENVTLSGQLVIGKGMFSGGNYAIGLVCGSDIQHGVDTSNVILSSEDETVVQVSVAQGTDRVELDFAN